MLWQFLRSRLTARAARDAADKAELEARFDWALCKAADGWHEWSHSPPEPNARWVMCARYEWPMQRVRVAAGNERGRAVVAAMGWRGDRGRRG
jgi:hypothetical protein